MVSKQLFVILFAITILTTTGLSDRIDVLAIRQDDTDMFVSIQSRVPHPQILITSPTDFVTLGFSGNGSESTPFLIEDLLITSVGQDVWDASCIRIFGCPDIYYIIRNCMISGSRGPWVGYAGISLESGYAKIEGCEIWNCSVGVATEGISIIIEDSRLWNCSESAIMVRHSNDCTIESSRIELYNFKGLDVRYSSNIYIQGNLFLCNPLGGSGELGNHMWIEGCKDIRLVDNELQGGSANRVLFARYCSDLLVRNNNFTSTGEMVFSVYSSNNTEVLDCTFEGGPLSLQRLPSFTIEGQPDFQTGWNSYVKNCTFTNFGTARVKSVENSTITNCQFYNTSVEVSSDSAKFLYNNLTYGHVTNLFYVIENVEIAYNFITKAKSEGIRDSGVNSYIHHNTVIGTGLDNSVGIDLSNQSIVHLNTIRNFHYGIYGPGSFNTGCVITNNTIQENTVGLYLGTPADENKVYYNYFIDNDIGAEDDGDNNMWDDGVSMGNYWTDIMFPGEYTIPGSSRSVDRYAQPYRPLDEVIANNSIVLFIASAGVVIIILVIVIIHRRNRK